MMVRRVFVAVSFLFLPGGTAVDGPVAAPDGLLILVFCPLSPAAEAPAARCLSLAAPAALSAAAVPSSP